ncbi:uncharacterized protein LOC129797871 [Phlebotomus papatasi]|uniref:Uncharacterized protein n=1 Tax=Phlebotomus papatasi TaxID=29031 RepID=A0A1B0DPC7_PHLPP|nr:uncharacterized protein LOC129797871 [Phlebotomus papatasi]
MTPFDDFAYLLNLSENPTIEDFILLTGTIVALVAFILWCCFPTVPSQSQPAKDNFGHGFSCNRSAQHSSPSHQQQSTYSKDAYYSGINSRNSYHYCS